MLRCVLLLQEEPESVQSQREGWGQRMQIPVLEEKLISSLKPSHAWNGKMCCLFSEASSWLHFADKRNAMFKICMLPHARLVFVLRWTLVCDEWTRSVVVMDTAESVKEFRCHHYPVDPHAFPREQAGFSDLNSSQGDLIAFYGEKNL